MWPPRQQVAVGTADQAQPAGSKWQSARPTRLSLPNPSVSSGDSSPFRGACDAPMPPLKGEA